MGDVEEMIGELEDEDGDEKEQNDEQAMQEEAKRDEGTDFGLDLDSAWGSPDREAED
jgi:hypothetical protein